MAIDIVKIVYFDEGSATDFVQIREGGKLTNTMTLFNEGEDSGAAGVDAKLGMKTKLLKTLIGIDAAAGVDANARMQFSSGTVVKSIVTNTVLTDFLGAVASESDASSSDENSDKCAIKEFSGLHIEQIPGSISTMALLTPYFGMFRSGQSIAAGDLDISIDKLDSALSNAKGYFEFCGADGEGKERVILRFNGNAFKNNYRPSDLLKMRLSLFAVKVGSTRLSALSGNEELEIGGFEAKDNPDYSESFEPTAAEEKELDMYDVILAGVTSGGK